MACQGNNFQQCNATNGDNVKLLGTNICDNTVLLCFWLGQLPVYAKCKKCNQERTLLCDLLTKLSRKNFKHEIQNLSLNKKKMVLQTFITVQCYNKCYYVSQKQQTLSTCDCTRAGYQLPICEHTTLSQFFIRCANDKRQGGKKWGGGTSEGQKLGTSASTTKLLSQRDVM